MSSFWPRVAAISGASAVLLGAFGAHGLKHLKSESQETWKTAATYHLVHSVALCIASANPKTRTSSILFSGGILLFSGSLYALVLTDTKALGAVAPVGGLLLTAGWLALAPWGNTASH